MRKLSAILLFAFLVCFAGRSPAQELFTKPNATHLTSFDFKMLTGGIILIKARVSDKPDSLNFVLDTGSGGISLDSQTVAKLRIPNTMTDRSIRGIAGVRKVRFSFNQQLHLPGLTVDSLDFHINDYAILTSAYGVKIDGIIGYSFLSRYIVHIDYDSLRIHVYTPGNFKYPRGGFVIRPFLLTIPVFLATVGDESSVHSRFYFDTGAGMCLLLSKEFAEDSAIISKRRKWYPSKAQGLGGKASMMQGVVKHVRIGNFKFKKVPAYIFEDEYNITAYPYLAGIVGNDILRRFNIILNYPQKDMYLMPNSHLRDKFDYSYTGLGIYAYDNVIEVEDIMEGSPAAKAGFKRGDIILAVNNNFSGDIQTYKHLMQIPGARVQFLVMRDGLPHLLEMKVGNILKRK